jgi:hypothetical protein
MYCVQAKANLSSQWFISRKQCGQRSSPCDVKPRAAEAACSVSRVDVGAVLEAGVGALEGPAGVEEMESGGRVSMG